MKVLRFQHEGAPHYGLLEGEKVRRISGDPHGSFQLENLMDLKSVELLAPCLPTKIICIGLNYKDHIHEMKLKAPEEPLLFLKAPSALNGPEAPIILPKMSQQVEYEGELAVVMGKKTFHVSEKTATEYIFGYTCFNDVTARDLQRKDGQFCRSKSFDTFACVGPWIETEINPSHLKIETRLNGKVKQHSNSSQLLFSIPHLVSFISHVMTLYPGDIISTGTPSGVGPLQKGDRVEVEIDGIGTLSNFIQ